MILVLRVARVLITSRFHVGVWYSGAPGLDGLAQRRVFYALFGLSGLLAKRHQEGRGEPHTHTDRAAALFRVLRWAAPPATATPGSPRIIPLSTRMRCYSSVPHSVVFGIDILWIPLSHCGRDAFVASG